MITTGFNPYQARVANNVRPRQNNVAFQANISTKLYNGVKEGEDWAYNDLHHLVKDGIITAKDGALVQARRLLAGDPENPFLQEIVLRLEGQTRNK